MYFFKRGSQENSSAQNSPLNFFDLVSLKRPFAIYRRKGVGRWRATGYNPQTTIEPLISEVTEHEPDSLFSSAWANGTQPR